IHWLTGIFAPCSLAAFWLVACSLLVTGRLKSKSFAHIRVRRKDFTMSEEHIIETRNGSSWQLPAVIVLGLVAIAGLGFGWNASSKLDSTKQDVTAQLKTAEQTVQQDMSSLKDRIAQDEKTNADLQGDLKVVADKLKSTQGQLRKARQEAAKLNDEATQKLSALDPSVHTELATKA